MDGVLNTIYLSDIEKIIPELVVIGFALGLLILGLSQRFSSPRILVLTAMAGCAGGFLTATLSLPTDTVLAFSSALIIDNFALFMKALITLSAIGMLALILARMEDQPSQYPYELPVLILLSVSGMMLMASAHNLLVFYLTLELQSLVFYILATIRRDDARASEAGIKYFVLGALASGLMLYGISLVYGFAQTINYSELALKFVSMDQQPMGVLLGMILIIIAAGFKLSAAPFHMWTPDVYEGSPKIITTFFATLPKIAMTAALLRLLYMPFIGLMQEWQQVIGMLAAISMLVGALAALRQQNIKRLLAYSTVGHVGFLLMAMAGGSMQAVEASIIYVSIYVLMNFGLFSFVLMMQKEGKTVEKISDLSGLSSYQPMQALCLLVLLFSMAGIPPFAGFISKFLAFQVALENGLFWLVAVGIISSVISAYYYLRIIKIMYFDTCETMFDLLANNTYVRVLYASALLNGILFLLVFFYPASFAQTIALLIPS